MPRFFLAAGNIAKGVALLTGRDAEHVKVLRMKLGEKLIICDGEGNDYHCHLTKLGEDEALAQILGVEPCPAEPTVAVTVLCGMPKSDKADYIVQKSVEAGASRIVFFQSQRCIKKPEGGSLDKKLERWNRISAEAASQSGRGMIPEVSILPGLVEAVDLAIKTDLPLFLYETGDRTPLREALRAAGEIKTAALITGPEGGFEQFEADIARVSGMRVCSMGPRILRCETAPVVALSAVMYETGNL